MAFFGLLAEEQAPLLLTIRSKSIGVGRTHLLIISALLNHYDWN
jgi:hypothetical protein